MAFLGLRKWPTPAILLQFLKPMWPFMAAGAIVMYTVSTIQDKAIRAPQYINDPKNPYAAQLASKAVH
ncbi:hypothetical protein FISHEDRAFT_45607 [Fistulina hepatica ATCC 64428]|uniref:ATPase, F0 complex, subunit J n=1 Tax=Fistulina hepatica ATCC 64428 TaxID=1128425 RepID=A0A0D7A9I7_9AGAR|nr:hypothetical protein FISHEDRAFT_45607 [Fistulina hepatica ATCC 64428]